MQVQLYFIFVAEPNVNLDLSWRITAVTSKLVLLFSMALFCFC